MELGLLRLATLLYLAATLVALVGIAVRQELPVHVVLATLGDAVFALAFSASLLYLVQERRLKTHRGRGLLRHLPSLETLDRVNYACLVWGLILLTLGIVSGIMWAHEVWGRSWSTDPKLV